MKIIVLHDRYNNNEPIIVRPDAIIAVRKGKEEEEYSNILLVAGFALDVKETVGTVMTKIKKVESDKESESK